MANPKYRYLWSTPDRNAQGWRSVEAADDEAAEQEARRDHADSDPHPDSEVVLVERY